MKVTTIVLMLSCATSIAWGQNTPRELAAQKGVFRIKIRENAVVTQVMQETEHQRVDGEIRKILVDPWEQRAATATQPSHQEQATAELALQNNLLYEINFSRRENKTGKKVPLRRTWYADFERGLFCLQLEDLRDLKAIAAKEHLGSIGLVNLDMSETTVINNNTVIWFKLDYASGNFMGRKTPITSEAWGNIDSLALAQIGEFPSNDPKFQKTMFQGDNYRPWPQSVSLKLSEEPTNKLEISFTPSGESITSNGVTVPRKTIYRFTTSSLQGVVESEIESLEINGSPFDSSIFQAPRRTRFDN